MKKVTSFFLKEKKSLSPLQPKQWFEKTLTAVGLTDKFSPETLDQTNQSVKVFYNTLYFSKQNSQLSIIDALTKTPAINVDGDKFGYFQNGMPFPEDPNYFANLPQNHPCLLSAEQRLSSGKKIIYSESQVFASGGFPAHNPKQLYKKDIKVGIFSMAGATFENDYLHYRLFFLDKRQTQNTVPSFAHLYTHLPGNYEEARFMLNKNHDDPQITHVRTNLATIARQSTGRFYTSYFKSSEAIIFLSEAYFRHQLEDLSMLLTAVNETAKQMKKPAFLKATLVGMGFFAKIDRVYDIHVILSYQFLRAFNKLLQEQTYPWIEKIEFPLFNETQKELFEILFKEPTTQHIKINTMSRDVLAFNPQETESYFTCVINPSDAFSYVGNEFGYGSVEAMIGNNSSLRFNQVIHTNPNLLNPKHHVAIQVNADYSTTLVEQQQSTQLKL